MFNYRHYSIYLGVAKSDQKNICSCSIGNERDRFYFRKLQIRDYSLGPQLTH